jgi:hypothetical protein
MTCVTERNAMPKIQKNFLIPEELAALTDRISELTGANFTKIATAALLQYIFDPALDPDERVPDRPIAPEWMTFAVRLDRGDITLADIPSDVLKEAALRTEYWLRGGKQDWADYWKKRRTARQDAIIRWQAALRSIRINCPRYSASSRSASAKSRSFALARMRAKADRRWAVSME